MISQFEVGRLRVFLVGGNFTNVSAYRIENLSRGSAIPWLCQAADRTLGLAGALTRQVEAHSRPLFETASSYNPSNCHDYFDQIAESPWDACFMDGHSIRFPEGLVYVLVEYVVRDVGRLNEGERKFIYFDCKRIFSDYLSRVKTEYPELTEEQALQKSLLEVSVPFKKKYGVAYDVLADIMREGYEKWRTLVYPVEPSGIFSQSHAPRVLRINEAFQASDDDWIYAVVESMMEKQEPKHRSASYTSVEVKHNVTGVEDAIDVEHEMRMEENRNSRINKSRSL